MVGVGGIEPLASLSAYLWQLIYSQPQRTTPYLIVMEPGTGIEPVKSWVATMRLYPFSHPGKK
jgi:hypothetical protein